MRTREEVEKDAEACFGQCKTYVDLEAGMHIYYLLFFLLEAILDCRDLLKERQ